jgi:transcription elongation factor GreA
MKKETKNNDLYLTKEGLEKLKGELDVLINEKRPEIVKRIKEAREMGDISENAMYDAARQEQSFAEGRIAELEDILKTAKISEISSVDEIGIGNKVKVHIEGSEEEFHIVGAPEANPAEGKISHESPLGVAMMGRKIGDKIDVEAPIGKLTYKVLHIS